MGRPSRAQGMWVPSHFQSDFSDCGSMLWCASRCFHSDRSPLLDAAFHSPAATADLSIRPRSQVNAPGLHLQSDSKISVQLVRFRTPAPAWLFVACRGAFLARNPLPDPILKLPACLWIFTPRQDLSIPPDCSAQPSSRQKSLP